MPYIPITVDEITPQWLGKILEVSINEKNFKVVSNTQAGNGYLSNLVRVSFETSSHDAVSIVIKFQPDDPDLRSLLVTNEWDMREINCYENVIPDLSLVHPPLQKHIPKFYYSAWEEISHENNDSDEKPDYKTMLILEDLTKFGYNIIGYGKEYISDRQLREGLEILAHVHFSGELLEVTKNQKLDELYPMFEIKIEKQIEFLTPILIRFYSELLPLIESSKNVELVEEYKSIEPNLEIMLRKICTKMDGDFKTVIHGDLWSNNILFNNDQSYVTKVIDWQIVDYLDSTVDVVVWIVTNLSEFNVEILEEYLTHYVNYFDELVANTNCEEYKKKRGNEEFIEFSKTYGLAYCFLWYVLLTVALLGKNDERLLKAYEFYQKMGTFKFLTEIALHE